MGEHNQGMAIGTGSLTINAGSILQKYCPDVKDQMRWPRNGLVCGGEGRGPKRVEGRLMEKVNPLVDQIVGETPFKEVFP